MPIVSQEVSGRHAALLLVLPTFAPRTIDTARCRISALLTVPASRFVQRSKRGRSCPLWVIFDRSGQSCLPVHVRLAPKADLRLGATDRRRVEGGRTPVSQAPKRGNINPSDRNLPPRKGLPPSRCCPTTPPACLG